MHEDLPDQPWLRTLQDLVAALPGLVSDRLELLALELQRAGGGLVQIMALALAAGMLATAGWLALCNGLGLALVALGLTWSWALLAVLLLNLALTWAVASRVRRLLANLGLPVTRRHLVFGAGASAAHGETLQRQAVGSPSEGRP